MSGLCPYKLIIFYGAGSGAGKSTLSYFTYRQFLLHDIPASLMFEGDSLTHKAFEPYVTAVREERAWDTDALWQSCMDFLDGCRQTSEVQITDSILPCSDWLNTAKVPPEDIEAFTNRLVEQLSDVPSLYIFISCDLQIALQRAIARRGQKWASDHAKLRSGSEDTQGLVDYGRGNQKLSRALWEQWPYDKLLIDTTNGDWEAYQRQILQYFSLEPVTIEVVVEQLTHYVGRYINDSVKPSEIRIDLRDGHLYATVGWPAGARLVPESDVRFNVDGTGEYLEFMIEENDVAILHYHVDGKKLSYTRVSV